MLFASQSDSGREELMEEEAEVSDGMDSPALLARLADRSEVVSS